MNSALSFAVRYSWLHDHPDSATPRRRPASFTVVCWNVLADAYARRKSFPYAAYESLAWEHRGPRVLSQLEAWQASVVCLQEVPAAAACLEGDHSAGTDRDSCCGCRWTSTP